MSNNLEKKADFIDLIAHSSGLSKVVATQIFADIKESILDTLKSGKKVSLFDLGVLTVNSRAARVGRNPKTGEPLNIAATNVPGFKSAKSLKDAVKSIPLVDAK